MDTVTYSHSDGSPDTFEGLQNICRCFAVALGHIFKDGEGMVIQLPFQEKYPNEMHGKFIVYKSDRKVIVEQDDGTNLQSGTWVWYHK